MKMSVKFLSGIAVFIILLVVNVFSGQVIIEESNEDIMISVSGLKPYINSIENSKYLSVEGFDYNKVSMSGNYDALSFLIAVNDNNSNLEYDIISERVSDIDLSPDMIIPDNYNINIGKTELQRGIKVTTLTFNPFRYDSESGKIYVLETVNFIIKLNGIINSSDTYIPNNEQLFFSSIINKKHLSELIKVRDNKKSLDFPELMNSDWFNTNLNYVKIETEKDVLYKVKISDLSPYLSDLVGKESKYLHLIHKGKSYPYYIPDDSGILLPETELIFYGKRAAGDTSWFDTYTNYESFYVTYDVSYEGTRCMLLPTTEVHNDSYINSINIDRHIEYDKVYGIGSEFNSLYFDGTVAKSNFNDTRTVIGEGWYWAILLPRNSNPVITDYIFEHNLLLSPSDNVDDKITMSLWYRTNQDSNSYDRPKPDVLTHYDLYYKINGSLKQRDSLHGYHFRSMDYTDSKNGFLHGLNNLSVETKQVYEVANQKVNIDFIEIKGNVMPTAYKGLLEFKAPDNDFGVRPYGFNSSRLFAFDKDNFRIKEFNSYESGVLFRLGGSVESDTYASLGIGDSIISSKNQGIHVFSYSADGGDYSYKHFAGDDASHNTYINSLSNGTAIAILILSELQITNNFSSIKNLGAVFVDDFSAGKVYAGGFIKGSALKHEQIAEGAAGFSEMFTSDISINHKFDITLPGDAEYLLCDLAAVKNVDRISSVNNVNLRNDTKIDAVYISHKEFLEQAQRLASYRENTLGLKVSVIDVEDIYNQFSYGRKKPHAIKDYLKYAYQSSRPAHVLLVGDASWDARKFMHNSISTNWVPTYGYPASDWWLVCLDGEDDLRPEYVIGRLPVNSKRQAEKYIDKVIEYESLPNSPWMKQFMFLIGGYSQPERNTLKNLINTHYRDYIVDSQLCGVIDTVTRRDFTSSTSSQGGEIRDKINQGKLWTIYIGHAAAELFDLDGWSAGTLNNKGRYGLLTTVSCNSSAFAEPLLIASRNEQYVLEEDKGFVVAFGGSFTGILGPHNNISWRMISALSDTSMKMRYSGELFNFGKSILSTQDPLQIMTLHTFVLIGDPLLRPRVAAEPDAYLVESGIKIVNQDGLSRFTDKDNNITISGQLHNYGFCFNDEVILRITKEYNSKVDTNDIEYSRLCQSEDFSAVFDILNQPGKHIIIIEAIPSLDTHEPNKSNNKIVMSIDVFKEGLTALDPQSFWDIDAENPRFRLINPIQNEAEYSYMMMITTSEDTNDVVTKDDSQTPGSNITIHENYIEWQPDITLEDGSYFLHARYHNHTNSTISLFTSIPFNVEGKIEHQIVNASIKSEEEFKFGNLNNLSLLKEDDGSIKMILDKDTLPFKVLGIKGNHPDNPEGYPVVTSRVTMELGNTVFMDAVHDLGINVVAFKAKNGKLESRVRLFETWGLNVYEHEFMKDSAAFRLVEFLRDSIADDEYVMIANCKSVFRLPYLYKMYGEEGNHASVDTLMYYLKSFGSKFADTLKFDENFDGVYLSFAMLGYRGAEPGTIPEAISFVGDSAKITGNCIRFAETGSYRTPTIRKSKQWNDLKFESNYPDNGTELKLTLFGINSQTGSTDTLLQEKNPENIDLTGIEADIYPEIFADVDYLQNNFKLSSLISNTDTYIGKIEAQFIPSDELALLKSESKFDKDNLLRGDKLNLSFMVENLSLRNDIDSTEMRINVSRGSGDVNYSYIPIMNLKKGSVTEKIVYEINTDYLSYQNDVSLNLDNAKRLNEFYLFNNNHHLNLNINRDTLKPTAVLKIDGRVHQYGDYISKLPLIEVELYDNSRLKITDSNFISVRINGYVHPYQRTLWSEFITVDDGTNLKAIFRFRPDTLQYDDASIIVYFRDNEDNRDTIISMAKLSLIRANAEDVYAYPNPASETVKFNINYIAPEHGINAKLEIIDLSGNLIEEINQSLRIGVNIIEWSGRHRDGLSLPNGVYFYRIRFTGDFYVEPVYGKFIIAR
jgi:hypothetical protein